MSGQPSQNRILRDLCNPLGLIPGPIERIHSQAYELFGVQKESAPLVSRTSYEKEWDMPSESVHQGLSLANQKTGGIDGNSRMNRKIGEKISELAAKQPLRILEIGPGNGQGLKIILDELSQSKTITNIHYFGVEPDLQRKVALEKLLNFYEVKYQLAMVSDEAIYAALDSESFDLIYSCAVFHHHSDSQYLKEIHRLLKPGGHLLVGDWFTSQYQHPASLANFLHSAGASWQDLQVFLNLHNLSVLDVKTYMKSLEPAEFQAQKMRGEFCLNSQRTKALPYFLEALVALPTYLKILDECGLSVQSVDKIFDHNGAAMITTQKEINVP